MFERGPKELSLRGVLIGTIITVLMTASNVYIGLRVGMTFSTAIPAAVISMAILRQLKFSTIQENCFVQSLASAAGTISVAIFIIPGLLFVGAWQHFRLFDTFMLSFTGGILGVLFTIPLRRALVVNSGLPYPEGVAAASVLKLGNHTGIKDDDNKASFSALLNASGLAFVINFFRLTMGWLTSGFNFYTEKAGVLLGYGFDYSLALYGAGYLVGLRPCMMLVSGTLFSWLVVLPVLSRTISHAHLPAETAAMSIWSDHIRFMGVGVIATAAIWTMIELAKPVLKGFQSIWQSHVVSGSIIDRTEKDMPIYMIGILFIITFVLMVVTMHSSYQSFSVFKLDAYHVWYLALVLSLLIVLMGMSLAAISGYMAGILGSSNSPISGIGLLSIIVTTAFLCYAPLSIHGHMTNNHVAAIAIAMSSMILATSAVSNDNLQDLKTGQLVGATPWKQQVALLIGISVGAMVIAPSIQLLYEAYGFVGHMPAPHMDEHMALMAPQATMMTTLATALITHNLDNVMLFSGCIIGIAVIIADRILKKQNKKGISALSIGIGIYLPPTVITPLVVGGFIKHMQQRLVKKHKKEPTADRGMMTACGFIVGESIFGILQAFLILTYLSHVPLDPDRLGLFKLPISLLIYGGVIYIFWKSIKEQFVTKQ